MAVLMSGDAEKLCLSCGLCCNGVIFAEGQLQPADDPARLRALGLNLKRGATLKFSQPCTAFDHCQCRIYAERPDHCRQFECALLQRVLAGELSAATAGREVRSAKRRAEKVSNLLDVLGDTDAHLPLLTRYRRTARRVEERGLDVKQAHSYAELTQAVHQLSVTLSRSFYP